MKLPSSQSIRQATAPKDVPAFKTGDQVAVHVRITEGDKQRIQVFEGVVMSYVKNKTPDANFTVRKISNGIGVERTFLVHSPNVAQIVLKSMGKVRRSKIYYVRELSAKKARIKGASRYEQSKRSGAALANKTNEVVAIAPTVVASEAPAPENAPA